MSDHNSGTPQPICLRILSGIGELGKTWFPFFLYNKNKIFVYMFLIAGQTAGLNGSIFLEGTHGYPGGNIG